MESRIDYTGVSPVGVAVAYALELAGAAFAPFQFKGFWRVARVVGRFAGHQPMTVRLSAQSRFRFLLDDPYWSRVVCRQFSYEPEILDVVRSLSFPQGTHFLDCGANFGFWSVLLSEYFPTIAIEASPVTFRHLVKNNEINDFRFECLNRAIYSTTNERLHFDLSPENHAGAGISETGPVSVETVAIDDLVRQCPAMLIKLDVEGAEIPALDGAEQTLHSCPVLIIYEDHGHDPGSAVTQHILSDLGLSVYFCDDNTVSRQIRSAEEAAAIKVNPKKGYNFFATQPGSVFDAQLAAITRR